VSLLGSAYSPSLGLAFDDDLLESQLLWIWGTPRSGSSWLLELLCDPLEPDVRVPCGFRSTRDAATPDGGFDIVPVDEPFIANHLAPAFADPIDVDGKYVPATLNNYRSDYSGYVFSKAFEEAWRPEFRRLALVRLWSLATRAREDGTALVDYPTFAIKEVNGSHAADLLMSVLSRSRMLFLARDGRDVVDSLLAAYSPSGFLARNQGRSIETAAERREAVRWASELWACNCDVALSAHESRPPELTRIVRYEDLLADCAGVLAPLFEWLGLNRSESRLQQIVAGRSFAAIPERKRGESQRARSARPGRWRENLSSDEQHTIMQIAGSRLERLGYGP
jgi:sulfotransferase family protein